MPSKKWPWMLRHFSIEKLYPSIAAKAQYLYAGGFWILARINSTEPIVRLYWEAESAAATAKLTGAALPTAF
jgi:phosphomannomutase